MAFDSQFTEGPLSRIDTVDVLLATFCGRTFLPEQLDSIVDQTYTNWRLIVRDDGSKDGTINITEDYARQIPRKIHFIERERGGGPCRSFASLLQISTSDYAMFCDQDDIWLADKIEVFLREMSRMEARYGKNTPILVHSDLKVLRNERVYDSLWEYQKLDPVRGTTLNRLLVQNTITGCATMINAPLRELCLPIPEEAIMHDWWVALVAAAFGKISHLSKPTMIYRQHSSNAIGAKQWGWRFIRSRLAHPGQIRQSLVKTQIQADAFLRMYQGRLSPEQIRLVRDYAELGQRTFLRRRWTVLRGGYFKNGLVRNIGLLTFI